MFLPIIHNLTPTDPGFLECQNYNRLIGEKPKGDMPLAEKIKAQALWRAECESALDAARALIGG